MPLSRRVAKRLKRKLNAVDRDSFMLSDFSLAVKSNAFEQINLQFGNARPAIIEGWSFRFFNAIPHHTKRRVLK